MTTDNKSITVKGNDIDKSEKPKYQGYDDSGVNPENDQLLKIKGTPFDLEDEDK